MKPLNNPFILAIKAYNLSVEIHHHSAYQIVAEKGSLNVLNIEPYSNVGLELSGMFETNKDYVIFDSPTEINKFFQTGKDTFDIYTIINALLSKLLNGIQSFRKTPGTIVI
jgi:hypothetical protein